MEYLVDNKRIRLNEGNMKFSKKIGEGSCAKVYLIKGEAYKLYKPYAQMENELMTKQNIEYLRNIYTKRIILPRAAILDKKRNLRGMISKYVENLGIYEFMESGKDVVIDSLKYLQEDAVVLGDCGVLINDASDENTSFNKGLYLIDCGRFMIRSDDNIGNIAISYNIDTINEYFIDRIMAKYAYSELFSNPSFFRREYYSILSKGISIDEYLKDDMIEDTFGEYIKRKVR